ncbi:MAG: hypothetical protein M1401_05990 [Chloroflexi bacterium]|nr:hypothetical protein [Chloroflexota bacterium]
MTGTPRGIVTMAVGLTMVGLGMLFLLQQLLGLNLWDISWPLLVVVPGLLLFVAMALGGHRAAPIALPASLVTTTGLILFYQNSTGHWESWTYAWALVFPTSLGLGRAVQGAWLDDHAQIREGLGWARLGVVIFVVGGVFFELVLGLGRDPLNRLLWPALLIAAGAYFLLRRTAPADESPTQPLPTLPAEPLPSTPPPDNDDEEDPL